VENCFGATHPGVYDERQKMYILNWRGVSFCFPAKEPVSTVQPSYAHGLGSLSFANSSLPLLERMTIFSNNASNGMSADNIPVTAYCGNIMGDSVAAVHEERRIVGLKILYLGENIPTQGRKGEVVRCERTIRFGDSEGSVLSALGAPSKIYYKSDERMLIQRSGCDSESLTNGDQPDYFFNYFTLGLDILFNFHTRRVIKFILHTNVPGHFDFAVYHRANFVIDVFKGAQKYTIRTDSRLEEFQSMFSTCSPEDEGVNGDEGSMARNVALNNKPVILNKCASPVTNDGENPFGSSFCYGTNQLIVELMDNSHIASVVLFE